jgi:ATP-dependent helicase HrpB
LASALPPLPIDPLLPELVASLRARANLVLEAPPGAGKTTRVPPAVLRGVVAAGQEVVVLEPRRLAARLSAARVAHEWGEALGETVGYQVRFENVSSARTRLRFVTPGVLLRQLLAQPSLPRVGAVLLDEFHERQLESDLLLALLAQLQRGPRPDLCMVVMSATLEAEPVVDYLAPCARLRSDGGPRFEVAVEYAARDRERDAPLSTAVSQAVRRLVREPAGGDILVFLPGAGEIRRAQTALADLAGVLVLPLHGDLPPAEQDRAVAPAGQRKVILSTNVAETSLTIDGVGAVVDGGLERIASFAPWSGLPLLRVGKISRAAAAQRAGRAGRTRAGRCLRLYTAADHDGRPAHELPEIRRLDLTETVLTLRAFGARDAAAFAWFETPAMEALAHADELLVRLGACGRDGALTALGQRMMRFPLHPRLARIVCEAESRGVAEAGCAVAAVLGERSGHRPRELASARSDVVIEPHALTGPVARAHKQLVRLCERGGAPAMGEEDAVLLSILAGYPDRVARRRAPHGREVLLCAGGAATLDAHSVVRDAELLLAVDAEERREAGRGGGELLIRAASAIEVEWLAELFPDELREQNETVFDVQTRRVVDARRLRYGELVLEERTSRPRDAEAAARVLAEAVMAAGLDRVLERDTLERLRRRVAFVNEVMPEAPLPPLDDAAVARAVALACAGKESLNDVDGVDGCLTAELTPAQRERLRTVAPEHITLPGGRTARVHYESDRPPYVASRIQDFFGMSDCPRLGGRVGLTLHLLAPNQRAVQVTRDLAGFWRNHYAQVRKELMRRYPKHAWPEDPLRASPPAPRRR